MRPCKHAEYVPGCPTCRWCVVLSPKGEDYRKMWGEPEPDPAVAVDPAKDGRYVAGSPPPTPKPMAKWPLTLRAIARLREPKDIGVGDTIHRVLRGDKVVKLLKRLGIDCGCPQRQIRLNAEFPYPT